MKYRIFQPTYRKDGQSVASPTYHVAFQDHMRRRQRIIGATADSDTAAAHKRASDDTHQLAGWIARLVRCRQTGEPIDANLQRWIDMLPDSLRSRLIAMEILDPRTVYADKPLLIHLDGEKDAAGEIITPGYRQALEAKGRTTDYIHATITRVRSILDGCGLLYWKDLIQPGTATRIEVYLGQLRTEKKIAGKTLNYYVRELRGFLKWLGKTERAPSIALPNLHGVDNPDVDSIGRRAISIEEMLYLLPAVETFKDRQGVTGEERAILYRFCFETGMRPGQVRQLLVSDFSLDGETPSVSSAAKTVKRRKVHTQALKPKLAAELKERFAQKLPTAKAFKMPSRFHQSEMFRDDLVEARAKWIAETTDGKEGERRRRSDFLALTNHAHQRAVLYSLRHGHGTALGDAGVPEKDIGASLHHAPNSRVTARYLHADQKSVARAIAALPDLSYPHRQKATGTDGRAADETVSLRIPCAVGRTLVDSGGQSDENGPQRESVGSLENLRTSAKNGEEKKNGLLAELADAPDSKSCARKGVSVRLR